MNEEENDNDSTAITLRKRARLEERSEAGFIRYHLTEILRNSMPVAHEEAAHLPQNLKEDLT
jgi:hypothetical protein